MKKVFLKAGSIISRKLVAGGRRQGAEGRRQKSMFGFYGGLQIKQCRESPIAMIAAIEAGLLDAAIAVTGSCDKREGERR
jgi:hypothetical protein